MSFIKVIDQLGQKSPCVINTDMIIKIESAYALRKDRYKVCLMGDRSVEVDEEDLKKISN